jgi:hypothetical protein
MKNLLLLFTVCIFAVQTQAQTNQNWAPIGAKWYYGESQTSSTACYTTIECIGQQQFMGKIVWLLNRIL